MGCFFSCSTFGQLPFITDNAGIMGKWNKQLEMSYGVGFDNSHRCTNNSVEISPVFTLGITSKIDIVVGYPFVFSSKIEDSVISRVAGFSDIGIEVKYSFLDYKFLHLTIKPGLSIPTGNYKFGLGNGKIGYSAFFISTFTFKRFNINSNLGYIRNDNRCGDAQDIWHVSAGFDYDIKNNAHIVLNSGIEKNPDVSSKTPPIFTILGLYYCLNENSEIALGYKFGCTKPETDHSFIVGTTFRF